LNIIYIHANANVGTVIEKLTTAGGCTLDDASLEFHFPAKSG